LKGSVLNNGPKVIRQEGKMSGGARRKTNVTDLKKKKLEVLHGIDGRKFGPWRGIRKIV